MNRLSWVFLVSVVLSILPSSATAQALQVPSGPVPPALFAPVGAVITVHVRDMLSSDRNRPGDSFLAALEQPLIVQGWVVARPGQTVIGRVAAAQSAGRGQGVSQLRLELTEMVLVDGQQVPVRTQLVESYGPTPHAATEAATVAAGTGAGAAIGAAIGHGEGAAIGAGVGAVATLAGVLATRGRPTVIYPETVL